MAHAKLIFITGGVRSGKSTFAERLATNYAERLIDGKLHYIACGQRVDPEMEARISHHQETRAANRIPWKTWECAIELKQLVHQFTKDDIILIDCLTTLLGNEMFVLDKAGTWQNKQIQNNLKQSILDSIKELRKRVSVIIIVSNEVLSEPMSSNSFTFTYAKLLGQLHQAIVHTADKAYVVESGILFMMKGDK